MKKNRKFTLLLLLVVITSIAQAQTNFGVRTGLGLTSAERKIDKKSTEDISSLLGYQIGVASEKNLFKDFVYGRLDFLFFFQKWENTGWKNDNPESTIKLNYLQVNPMLKIGPPYWSDFYVQSGLYIGYAIRGKNNGQIIQFGKEADKMKALDFGGVMGLGWQYDHIQLGFDLQLGFSNLSNIKNTTLRNRNLMLTATYLFGDHPSPQAKMNYNAQTDTIKKPYRFKLSNKREKIYLHFSLPQFNFLRMMPENEGAKGSRGIRGGAIGLEYHYSNNQYIHFEVSFFSNYGLILPPHNDEDLMSSDGINFSNNHKLGRFSLGYGLSYSNYTLGKYFWFLFVLPIDTKSHNAFGLVFPVYFHAAEFLNIGVVYKPTFFRPNISNNFSYEHLVTIDFAWKIRIL